MNKQELLIKYIDKETSTVETQLVEKMLRENPTQQKLHESLKQERLEVLTTLNELNPKEAVLIPDFEYPSKQKSGIFRSKLWHIAAAVVILLASTFTFLYLQKENPSTMNNSITEASIEETQSEEFEDLNYFISPNRSWNKRQLIWTSIEME